MRRTLLPRPRLEHRREQVTGTRAGIRHAIRGQRRSGRKAVGRQRLIPVDRNRPGDANNDGYDESRGSYHILATGPRLELKLVPQSTALARPVLEIIGMPAGEAIVNVEGRLVEDVTRLEDGTLLVQIPTQIDRPTSVSVNIQ